MESRHNDLDLRMLGENCQVLETQCGEYVRELQRTNKRLNRAIDRHKRTASELKASEAKLRKLFEHAPFGVAIANLDGKIIIANRALGRMVGYEKHDLESMHLTDITHKSDINKDVEQFQRLISGEIENYSLEKRYMRKDGKTVWGSLAVALLPDTVDGGRFIIGMVEDISTRKMAHQKIIDACDDLEDVVANRTLEIQQLKDRLQAENVTFKQELSETQIYGTIIGDSPPIRKLVSQIELVAPTDATVLVQGESGTGKELVAREIHHHSNRKEKPMVKVNCATIPKDLYESEFFGHVKGAFTGAVRDRIGRFEAANGGTIFLDEVGEIPLDLQSKLLRILQEGEYERLGEERTRRVDVRLIAATNKDLSSEIRAGRFRNDLFYRLNVFPIQIAPLRERKSDIPVLARHFIEKLSRKLNVTGTQLTKANIMDLQSYEWPGNVRELENAIERAIILSRSKRLNFNQLKRDATRGASLTSQRQSLPEMDEKVISAEEMKQLERRNTINALIQSRWKIYGTDGAARLLSLKPTTLIERMKRMNIRKPTN